MTDRPYHHGRLRATLLAEAERALRDRGVEGLSLRDLAREAGVSHAAPRRHFPDRQALLGALAEGGFARLIEHTRAVVDSAPDDSAARLAAMARGYVQFATHDAALLELMFTERSAQRSAELDAAAHRLFATLGEVIGDAQRDGTFRPGDPEKMLVLFVATLQGIATFVTSRRLPPDRTDGLVEETLELFAP